MCRALREQTRARDGENYLSLKEMFASAWRRLAKAEDERTRINPTQTPYVREPRVSVCLARVFRVCLVGGVEAGDFRLHLGAQARGSGVIGKPAQE
jgi:hypothetical protein